MRNFFLPQLLFFLQDLLQLQALLLSRGRTMSVDEPGSTSAHRALRHAIAADLQLPAVPGTLSHTSLSGETLSMAGTNVVRVPFGVRRPRRARPERPEHWATVVLPFHLGGSTPPPPQAA